MKTVLLRLSGFTPLPILSLVTPLLLLQVNSGFVGARGTSRVLSGQPIGIFAATVIVWEWNIDGPGAIARTEDRTGQSLVYLSSILTRLILLVAVSPMAAAISAVTVLPEFRSAAISMALASTFVGMSPAWYCIGLGQPRPLASYDTVPRFLATIASIPLLLLTHRLWTYTALLGIATAVSLVLFHRRFSPRGAWFPSSIQQTLRELKSQAHTAGNSCGSTPVPIATATTSPAATGSLATADPLYRFGLFSIVALGNALQAWVLEHDARNARARQLLGIGSHILLGVIGAVVLTLLGPAAVASTSLDRSRQKHWSAPTTA